MDIPEHLVNANMCTPPNSFTNYARMKCESEVLFIDDIRYSNSVRYLNSIIVNIRGTYWANYVQPPISSKSFPETIVLRFLHEVGHIYYKHPGEATFNNTGQLNRENVYQNPFIGREGEAWKYAFDVRENDQKDYYFLLSEITIWLNKYIFTDKDWADTIEEQCEILRKRGSC